jgi:hypothetical protein
LLAATVLLLLAGGVLFWTAASFEGYITALLVMAVAALCLEGRRELQAREKGTDAPGSSTGADQALAPRNIDPDA